MFTRVFKQLSQIWPLTLFIFFENVSHAASLEGSLQSLVNGLVNKILPVLSLGYVGKNIFAHIQNDPEASRESIRVSIAVVALLGLSGVWSWLQGHVR